MTTYASSLFQLYIPAAVVRSSARQYAYAVSETLEKIAVSNYWRRNLTDDDKTLKFLIGQGEYYWDLPQLKELIVFIRIILLRTHPYVVSRYPRLTRLVLKNLREGYNLDKVVYWVPTELPQLEVIHLLGSPAIALHPNILHSPAQLKDLRLEMSINWYSTAYISPAEELDSDDDYHIGWLQMLASTPNFELFHVWMQSLSGDYRRTIEIADLIEPRYHHPALDRFLDQDQQRRRRIEEQQQHGVDGGGDVDGSVLNNSSSDIEHEREEDDKIWKDFKYVNVPALKHFHLQGPWSLDSRVLDILFLKVAPGLEYVYMSTRDSPQYVRRLQLIATLLLSVPKTHITDLLRATFPQVHAHQERYSAPFAPYHSFLTNVRVQYCSDLSQGRLFDERNPPSQELVDYMTEQGLEGRYFAEAPLTRLAEDTRWRVCNNALTQDIRRDLTWALCSNPEHVRSLVIPISDIARYLTLVCRFKILSDVTFALNRQLHNEDVDLNDLTPEERTVLDQQLKERARHLDQMILFVRELQQHHSGVLRTASCPPVSPLNEECPDEYEAQLLRLLPPLIDPQHLDDGNWPQFANKVGDSNLSLVRSIRRLMFKKGTLPLARLLEQIPFLHRCRSLESIQGASVAEDVFQWAVDERRQHDVDIAAGRSPQQPLVPLKDVDITNGRPSDGRLLNDIGFAFGNTLTSLSFSSFSVDGNPNDLEVSADCLVGSHPSSPSWNAPRLSYLFIGTDFNFLRISPNLLAQCPQLTTIMLDDRRQEYSFSDITQWQPAELRHLQSLKLRGSPALSFYPDTLRTTRNLRYLDVTKLDTNGLTYIPPAAEHTELEDDSARISSSEAATTLSSAGRPVWTWDWYLPMLTHLQLDSEFAYGFQFKFLQQSISSLHKRAAGVKDHFQNTQGSLALEGAQGDDGDSNDNDSLGFQSEYIHLPLLEILFGGLGLHNVEAAAETEEGKSLGSRYTRVVF
ncbi:hypothetical protein BG015_006129 [Linnemannia schmuckeri]|uniref:Uncharacterized protein n=1 Tax=Linnemannia schmuckeri TaxID=64567 RepID=A0A9P5VBQ2_9FUNG|nr:hypothetical protein BG015_006129 [Linnemannia schmuckeri]